MRTLDRAALWENVDGDVALLAEIVAVFLDTSPALVDDVRSAVAAGSATSLHAAAHRLRGALLNLGAEAAAGAVRELERMGREGDLGRAREALDGEMSLLRTELTRVAGAPR